MRLAISGPAKATHGNTIIDRLRTEKAVGWQPDPNKPAQLEVKKMEFESLKRADASSKDKNIKAINADEDFAKTWRARQADIGEGSPFKVPAIAVLARSKAITSSPIWQKYIAPTFSTGDKTDLKALNAPISERLVFQAAATAVLERTTTSAQAARFVADLFSTGIGINNEVNQFQKIAGLEQTMYGVRIPVGASVNILGGMRTVNAVDITDITKAINEIVKARIITGVYGAVTTERLQEFTR
jgi:hypothetical protein